VSYCRFHRATYPGVPDSDVYVFHSVHGHWECCMCRLCDEGAGDHCADSPGQMVEHLLEHRRAGHSVPEYALESLVDEQRCQHALAAGQPQTLAGCVALAVDADGFVRIVEGV
jgi:hypothetical protein